MAANQEVSGPPPAGDSLSDEALVERIRQGDERSFELLFDRHADAVRARVARWLPGRIRRKVSVVDLLQEVRLVAFQRLPNFEHRGPGSFRNWLLRIAQRKVQGAAGHYGGAAKRSVWLEVSRGARPATGAFAGREPSPSEVVVAAETRELARKAMKVLTDEQAEVLRLVREERMPLREVAERLGRTYEATKKLHGRALLRLTEEFERLGGTRA
ncbi:MAG: RNA polymerase sigma factor [Planctomycetota bacterium]